MQDKEVIIGDIKVKVIRENCIGAASCVAFAPNVFELDSEKKAVVKDSANDTRENIMMAAQSCPTQAIAVFDAQTGEQLWPQ
jgi:ferredoxin